MSRKSRRNREGGGFKRLLGWTVVLALVFSAGLISGERLVRKKSLEPLISVSDQISEADLDEDEEAEDDKPTTFAFFDQLTRRADISLSASQKKEAEPEKNEAAPKEAAPKDEAAAAPKAEAEADEQAQEKPPEEAAQPANNEQQAAGEGEKEPDNENESARYTLQVAAHPDLAGAKEHMERLKKMGLEPQLVSASIPGKGEFYRVRIGEFSSMDEAREFQTGLKSKNSLNTFVSPL